MIRQLPKTGMMPDSVVVKPEIDQRVWLLRRTGTEQEKRMAWRPAPPHYGILDNTTPGKVTGFLRFRRQGQYVDLPVDLDGEFHLDIRRTVIKIQPNRPSWGLWEEDELPDDLRGGVGDITLGFKNPVTRKYPYVSHPYIEMFVCGRMVFELHRKDIRIISGRKWGMFGQENSVNRIIQGIIESRGWTVDTIKGRSALLIAHSNGVRETIFLPDPVLQHIRQTASAYCLTVPSSSNEAQIWWGLFRPQSVPPDITRRPAPIFR